MLLQNDDAEVLAENFLISETDVHAQQYFHRQIYEHASLKLHLPPATKMLEVAGLKKQF